ncbi:MAG: 1-acyl-sn-glycerol-3-phosphate acyltransferase [Anaerotruncus sp.]|jgi:1-acyl-sn-glycerol-3-phosphate acyltransferase|nr:1-acyl-sn-glycerol-3-phosphate acyltransferase [Anaerotruncus sp.]
MLRRIFHLLLRLFLLLFAGANVYGRENLPAHGPAIIAANHNSHLDALLLLSLFSGRQIHQVRVAAAADYFFKGKRSSKLYASLLGLLPIAREGKRGVLDGVYAALERGEILILFPEGTRGAPGELSPLKNGISRVARRYPEVPVIPVFLQGTERALPKGHKLFVPLIAQVRILPAQYYHESRTEFVNRLSEIFQEQAEICQTN